jgi:hypothetical protein
VLGIRSMGLFHALFGQLGRSLRKNMHVELIDFRKRETKHDHIPAAQSAFENLEIDVIWGCEWNGICGRATSYLSVQLIYQKV